MSQIETLKRLREDLVNSEQPQDRRLSGAEVLAIIECLPELLAAKDERDALLEQKRQVKKPHLYAVYIGFFLRHDQSFERNVVEGVESHNPDDAFQRVWNKIESIYRNPVLQKHVVLSITDNLTN